MRVQVLVTVEVESCGPNDFAGSTGEFQAAATEAINHAVQYGQGEGFVHELAEVVSIRVVNVEHYEGHEG
ncbi:MAG: hypothetical protein FJW39_34205 [Acidobacteria bacterium]|nr:hypothetical protein [Acidobacteriota bacterium]